MPNQTDLLTSFEAFLEEVFPLGEPSSSAARTIEIEERRTRLVAFPHEVVLQLAYPKMDFATRWCWEQFGPADGKCYEYSSDYPACPHGAGHAHKGKWLTHWLAKTDYDFGFNTWCFANQADQKRFLKFVPHITWGETYEG